MLISPSFKEKAVSINCCLSSELIPSTQSVRLRDSKLLYSRSSFVLKIDRSSSFASIAIWFAISSPISLLFFSISFSSVFSATSSRRGIKEDSLSFSFNRQYPSRSSRTELISSAYVFFKTSAFLFYFFPDIICLLLS